MNICMKYDDIYNLREDFVANILKILRREIAGYDNDNKHSLKEK